MRFKKKNSLTDQFHSHGVIDFEGRGYHIRKDGAISIVWQIDAGNSLRFTPEDFEHYTTQLSKTIGFARDHTQFDVLYDKRLMHWQDSLNDDLQTQRPEITKLMQLRKREIGLHPNFALDIYLTITFNHLVQYRPPPRFDFFKFNGRKSAHLTRKRFEQDVRLIENTAQTVESDLRCFTFERLSGDGITKLLKSYYNLTAEPVEQTVRDEFYNGDLVYKNFLCRYDDLTIGLDHLLVASMCELPDKAVNPIEVEKRFLRSPVEHFLSMPFPLRLSINIEKLSRQKAQNFVQFNTFVNKPRFNNMAELKMIELEGDESGELFDGVSNLIEFEKDYLAHLSLTVMTWHPERAVLAERQERIASSFARFFNSRGMIEHGQDALNTFLSCAPGNYPYRRIPVRGAHVGHFVSLSGHYRGMNSGVPLINTADALVYYDLFDTANDNYNALIVGPSGKGKSFFCNSLIFNYIAQAVPVIILDLSGSYKPLAEVLRSDYVQIDRRRPNYLDPFNYFDPRRFPHNSPNYMETFSHLQSFINLMVRHDDDAALISKDKKAVIYEALEKFLSFAGDGKLNLHGFTDFIKVKGDEIFEDDRDFLRYVVKTMGYYLEKSNLKVYFDPANKNHLSMGQGERFDLLVFDLKGIEREIELMPLYANLLSMLVMEALHQDFEKFFFILDEAWKALENSEIIYGLIKEAGRTSRKHFGSVAALTQNIDDLRQGDLAASVLTNSFSKFLLPHGGEDLEKAVKVLDMTKAEQRAFRNLRKHEILLCREGEPILAKIPFSRYDYWTWTTQPDEVDKRNNQLKYEPTMISAISALAEQEVVEK